MTDQSEWIITCAELAPLLGKVTLLDVREPEEHAEARIEGCKLIPLGELTMRAPKELKKDADIVAYCHMGGRSLQAVLELKMLGFEKVRSLEGGIVAWQTEHPAHSGT